MADRWSDWFQGHLAAFCMIFYFMTSVPSSLCIGTLELLTTVYSSWPTILSIILLSCNSIFCIKAINSVYSIDTIDRTTIRVDRSASLAIYAEKSKQKIINSYWLKFQAYIHQHHAHTAVGKHRRAGAIRGGKHLPRRGPSASGDAMRTWNSFCRYTRRYVELLCWSLDRTYVIFYFF